MSDKKVPQKCAIEKAVLASLPNGEKLERKQLISKSIEKHGYSQESLKDRSCESLSTELKSLTGVVINEMLAKGMLINEGSLYFAPIVDESQVKAEATTNGKSLIKKKRKRKKPVSKDAKCADAELEKKYPDTELGKALAAADKKFLEYKQKKVESLKADKQKPLKQSYLLYLKRAVTNAINIAGGEFFEELSMKLLLACYGESVVENELTAGPEDNGIDGIITIKDGFGFTEKVYFQAKTKISERKNVSIKVARELLGVMHADRVTKGILITNSSFVRDTKVFVNKVPHLALIDANQLFALMCEHKIGVKEENGILHIDDNLFLPN